MKKRLLTFVLSFFFLCSFSQIANQPSDIIICDDNNDGFAFFDLTVVAAEVLGSQAPTDFVLTYHETLVDADNGTNAIPSPFSYANVVNPQTIYLRLEELATGNYATTSFNLIVNLPPLAVQPTPLEVCDDNGDEIAIFDLTVKDSEIIGGNASLSVAYYETNADAQAQTNAIADPTQYANTSVGGQPANPQTIYVVVTDTNTGCIDITTLTIRVLPIPTPTPSDQIPALQVCDDDSDGFSEFDLTENEALIMNGEADIMVSYYETLNDAINGANFIDNPTLYGNTFPSQQTIYVRVENALTGCFTIVDFDLFVSTSEIEVEIVSNDLFIDPNNDPSATDQAILCGFVTVTIEADSPFANLFIWYKDGFVIPGETSNVLTITDSGVYQAEALDNQCTNSSAISQLVEVSLYDEPPMLDSQNITLCDGPENDGVESFDLQTFTESLGLDSEFVVSYHTSIADANLAINAVSSPYTSSGETLIIRIEDVDAFNDGFLGCRQLVSLELVISDIAPLPNISDLVVCDFDLDGVTEFDLTVKDQEVLAGQSQSGLTVTYHLSESDAIDMLNPLSLPYTNVTNPQTIYVAVTAPGCNTETQSFNLVADQTCEVSQDIVMQNGTFTSCDGLFTDSGGPDSNYSPNEDYTITICPENDQDLVGLNFTSFSTQLNIDILSIYDGDSTDANLIGLYSGGISPGLVIASEENTTGCLTLTFISNATGNSSGWEAEISCYQACQDITAIIDSTTPQASSGIVLIPVNGDVAFSAGEITFNDGTEATYSWDFGDGNSASGLDVSNTFTTAGSYTVTLTVEDANPLGCQETASITVVVLDAIVTINNEIYPESLFSPEELVTNVLIPNGCFSVNIFSSQVNGSPTDNETKNYGYFNRGDALGFPFEEGIVLTTGVAFQGGNALSNILVSNDNGQPGDADLEAIVSGGNTNDAAFIKFNFVPSSDTISFRYLMASEEYDGSTECTFADGFAFLLREVGTTEYTNLAVLPDGTPVNVTNINNSGTCTSNPEFFAGYNIGDTNYGGRTEVLTATASVTPNVTYEIKLVVADEGDSIWDTAIFIEAGSFSLGNGDCDEIGLINVRAFNDSNTNDDFDDGEPSFTNGTFTYEKNNDGVVNVVNTSTGSFTIISTDESDTYDIDFAINDDYTNCYTQTVTSFDDVSVSFGEVAQVDFPVDDNLTCQDLAVYLINPFASPRPGFEHRNLLTIENLSGAAIASGSVDFTVDEDLIINATSVSNSNLTVTTTSTGFTLDFIDLAAWSSETVDITLLTPVSVPLDEIVTNTATYTTVTNDTVLDNNNATLSEVVIGSYDPNDKMEAHGPEIIYDDFVVSDEYLFYTIRFQNIGTAEAIFVRIEDVLDSQLDENTFEMLRSSHDYVVTRTDNNLEWFFDDINLPAEQDDAEGSIGYVYFKIKPKPGYAVGDIVSNNAAIYFDFNDPIITNTFTTTFVEPLSIDENTIVDFDLYPNPANSLVTVEFNNVNSDCILEIFDIQGKRLYSESINSTRTIDISSFKAGMYFVKLSNNNVSKIEKLVVD
ncbi:choice-of-anchor L domain-containing protein [Winogradskyella sp.]|uniref:DUF7619 domain-containing protein n=1 Tax=Winogradskyella sp. TaxID=1883156 RepID=UPI00261023CC|nr:choice-of-anchor L domain-containing protein [Winogradskyella sp.]